jgi:4'-phosphopantetheinyl transferase EntD
VPLDVAFDLKLPHGRCLGVEVPSVWDEAALAVLDPAERAHAATLSAAQQRTWIGGRLALRATFAREGIVCGPVLATARGAPALPEGVSASLSHKDRIAVALVARGDGATRGVDVEIDRPEGLHSGIAARVLCDDELADVETLPEPERARAVLVRFSIKEAVYKAIDPHLLRYVGFKEVRAWPAADGSVRLEAAFAPPLALEACWTAQGPTLLATALCRKS